MAKSGVTPKKFQQKANGTPRGAAKPGSTPGKPGLTPGKQRSPMGTPGNKFAKQKGGTPQRAADMNGDHKVHKKFDTPRPAHANGASAKKQQQSAQKSETFNAAPKQAPNVNKPHNAAHKKDAPFFSSNLGLRLTFPHGELKSLEQVKKLVPTAVSVKFPNVVFVEFASEPEADRMREQLQAMVTDNQLLQVSYLGEKERQHQASVRTFDQTRLFVGGVGKASEADIRRLFPTASSIVLRRQPKMGRIYCFVIYETAAACKEALEKSKGLTLFGNPISVNYAFARRDTDTDTAAQKRPNEQAAKKEQPTAKKAKSELAKVTQKEEVEDEQDDEEDEDDDEDEEDEDVDDEEGDDEEEDDDDDGDDNEEDDDDEEDDEE